MTDKYDAAIAKVEALKLEYAAHKEQQKERRKPLTLGIFGVCMLVIAWLLFASGGFGPPLVLVAVACGAFLKAYGLWAKRS